MPAALPHSDIGGRLAADRLTTEFRGQAPERAIRAAIRAAVARARADVAGQLVPPAVADMLHRLVHHRPSRSDPGQD